MGRRRRIIIVIAAAALTAIAAPPRATAGVLDPVLQPVTPVLEPVTRLLSPESGTVERLLPPEALEPLLAPESACPGQSDSGQPIAAQARTMACMHSYARVASGLSAVRVSKPLRASATQKARDIRRCQEFSHRACGRNPFYWVERVGFFKGSSGAAENLAYGSGARATVRATMSSWLNSDGHRAVLLQPRFGLIGIGAVTGRFRGFTGTTIWVAHLGYRR